MTFAGQSEGKPSDLIVATLTLAAVLPRRVDACHACIIDESAFVSLTVQNKCIVVPLSFIRFVVHVRLFLGPETTELVRWIVLRELLLEDPGICSTW